MSTHLLNAYEGVLGIGKLVRNRSPNVIEVKGNSKPGLEISLVAKRCKELETAHGLNPYVLNGDLIKYLMVTRAHI